MNRKRPVPQGSGTSVFRGYTVVVYRGGATYTVLSEMYRRHFSSFLRAWLYGRERIRAGSGVHAVSIYRGADDTLEALVWSKESTLRRSVAVPA